MYEWFGDWLKERNSLDKKSIIVCNRWTFQTFADLSKGNDDIAYISISASKECASEYFLDLSEADHYLSDADNVLNLNFDDITEDFTFKNEKGEDVTYHAISEEQAERVIDFVGNNIGKHFIVHCRAGKSRSQAVCRAIYDCYDDVYEPNKFNKYNPCNTPNPDVLAKVKRAFYKKNGFFKDN